MDAESATLGKLIDRVVDGGRSFPWSPVESSPVGRETWTSRELIAELTPVNRPVLLVVGVEPAVAGARRRRR